MIILGKRFSQPLLTIPCNYFILPKCSDCTQREWSSRLSWVHGSVWSPEGRWASGLGRALGPAKPLSWQGFCISESFSATHRAAVLGLVYTLEIVGAQLPPRFHTSLKAAGDGAERSPGPRLPGASLRCCFATLRVLYLGPKKKVTGRQVSTVSAGAASPEKRALAHSERLASSAGACRRRC